MLHFADVRYSLAGGFYQGWDLHAAQLVSRYAAVASFYLEGIETAGARLNAFLNKAATATLVGGVLDEPATGQGLLGFFLRAMQAGAITESEAVRAHGTDDGRASPTVDHFDSAISWRCARRQRIGMSGSVFELLDLIARWVHVIAGIMWIGNSMLFNWLDRSLVVDSDPSRPNAPLGTIWLLHSGGFYYVEKTMLRGQSLPHPLHWFKWQAYTTWISGVALLVVVYYASDRAVLADPSVLQLSHRAAIAVGLGAIVVGWALYESMQRLVAPRAPAVAAAVWIVGLTAIAIALTQVLSGRAAFLHVGAMLGTIMAGNVAMTIVPSQRQLVASVAEGRGADAAVSARAKRVSIHNNYFTFPVIALMVSNHFPTVYGHRWNWAAAARDRRVGCGGATRAQRSIHVSAMDDWRWPRRSR